MVVAGGVDGVDNVGAGAGAGAGGAMKEEPPDFVETQCHWRGCGGEFHTQDGLVKVGTTTQYVQPVLEKSTCREQILGSNRCAR